MTVYNINLESVGPAVVLSMPRPTVPSCYAISTTSQVCFMDMILADNIQHLTENIGFKNDESSGSIAILQI